MRPFLLLKPLICTELPGIVSAVCIHSTPNSLVISAGFLSPLHGPALRGEGGARLESGGCACADALHAG